MATMNISLPDGLKSFIDHQLAEGGYSTASEYVRDLLRREQERLRLRGLLLDGAASPVGAVLDDAALDAWRDHIAAHRKKSG